MIVDPARLQLIVFPGVGCPGSTFPVVTQDAVEAHPNVLTQRS